MKRMKVNAIGLELIKDKLLKLPNIKKYETIYNTGNNYVMNVEMDDGYRFNINVYLFDIVYPSIIMNYLKSQEEKQENNVIVAPYISERTAKICEDNELGYFDYSGNSYFLGHSIYILEKGNKNLQPKEYKSISIFDKNAIVSSCIIRELLVDVTKIWKIKYLSEKVNCSIGQVSKLMKVLVENAWVEKSQEGYKLVDPESLLQEWCKEYSKKEIESYKCYSLDDVSIIEERLKKLKDDKRIDYYLTGFAGGVRYAPVVRYNKIHIYISPENVKEAINYLGLKEVESGSNVAIIPLENNSYIKDSRVIDGSMVVSPVQIYLDCMQIKGRGQEMADAVLKKEIIK